ncbi:MAG TPA: PAS domain S-box protein [Candidatus Angelobacter sp.]|jgi:PAS domain S-box-containing protein
MVPLEATPKAGPNVITPGITEGHSLQSERVFRLLVESVRDYAIFLLTPDGIVASWNPGAERMKQYKPHEIIGKPFTLFYSSADNDSGKPQMELRVAAEVGRYEEEGWRIRKDGTRFWANVIINAVRDKDGSLLGFGKVTRDITDRREAELRYRLLIEGVTDYAIYSLDKTGTITSWNSGAQRIKGYSADEIIGRHFSQFYTKEDAEAGLPARVLATAAATGHYEGEGWRQRKDGTRFWSSVVVTPLRDEAGELVGFSKITRDITDRKQLLEKIRAHAEELEVRMAESERSNAELEAFSYSVSHDLRAPLRAIEGFSDFILTDFGGQLPPQVIELLQNIVQAADRMNRLVQDLLNYSRLSRIDIQSVPVNVATAIKDASEQIEEDLRRNITSSINPALMVKAHKATLTQAIFNLVNNGLKFYPPKQTPHVDIKAYRDGHSVTIEVCDEGIGIAPQHQERIFQVFERLHTAEAYPGTGIGLAIVRRGINRMGGAVRVESSPGKGSRFFISLPAA